MIIPVYDACISRAIPVYTISQVTDSNGVKVDYERMLMPFGGHHDVDHIIASLKTISEDGAFNIRNLMRGTNDTPEYSVRGVIDRDLDFARPSADSPQDAVEFV